MTTCACGMPGGSRSLSKNLAKNVRARSMRASQSFITATRSLATPIDVGFDHQLPEDLLERASSISSRRRDTESCATTRPSLRMITSVATRSTLSSTCEL